MIYLEKNHIAYLQEASGIVIVSNSHNGAAWVEMTDELAQRWIDSLKGSAIRDNKKVKALINYIASGRGPEFFYANRVKV